LGGQLNVQPVSTLLELQLGVVTQQGDGLHWLLTHGRSE
jgi:hypothetical protein